MTQIFITGDRNGPGPFIGHVAIEMLRAAGNGDTIVTGDNDGTEAAVRDLAEQSGFPISVVASPRTGPNGTWVDWDKRHSDLVAQDDLRVVAFHGAPHASRVVRSLANVFGDSDRLEVRGQEQFLIGVLVVDEEEQENF